MSFCPKSICPTSVYYILQQLKNVHDLKFTLIYYQHLSDQGTFTPVGAQGVFHETPPLKITTFPPEFCNEICTIYVWTLKNHNSGKKN